MKIDQRSKNNIEILELAGELDFHSSPELRDKLQELVKKQAAKILINLKKVSYIDSSGLATFVETLQKMKRQNGQLILSDLVPAVRSVFEIAKLDHIFQLSGSEQEALVILEK